MTGGLIQIVAYGTADVFLTGMPQITFFKLVYRRYTNFAIENIEQTFSGTKNFGNTLSCTLDKVGDLINKMYLKVVLPNVSLTDSNFLSSFNTQDQFEINNLNTQYTEFKDLINYFYKYYRELNTYISKINQSISLSNLYTKIMQITNMYYTASEYNNLKTKYNNTYNKKYLINDFIISPKLFNDPNIQNSQFNNFKLSALDIIKNIISYEQSSFKSSSDLINRLNKELFDFKNNSRELDKYLFNNINNYTNLHKNYPNYKFAWVKKIGHQIINTISLEIGGQLIDRHTNDWYNIWNELSLNSELETVYNTLIGNVDELIRYDYSVKNSYTLYIPLKFWFNKFIAGSFPLVFLRYGDVRFELQLNDIRNLIKTNAPSDYDFEDSVKLIDISLLVDYIYLDVDERSKFAQSEQECLIEVVQNYNYNSINSNNVTLESYFINSVKEMYWIAQSKSNLSLNFLDTYDLGIIYQVQNITKIITNNNIEQKIQILLGNHIFNVGDIIEIFNSQNYNRKYKIVAVDLTTVTIYSKFFKNELDCFVKLVTTSIITDSNNSNPFINTNYTFEQFNRFQNYDYTYTNYVQPWQFHTKTPANGINSYSFSIEPEEYQPSGAVNLSNYKYKSFQFTLDNKLINYIKNKNDTLIIKTYALGYNLISLKNGMAGLVFNI
jgi:hypothetical protein